VEKEGGKEGLKMEKEKYYRRRKGRNTGRIKEG
jgi:hypothetical protein